MDLFRLKSIPVEELSPIDWRDRRHVIPDTFLSFVDTNLVCGRVRASSDTITVSIVPKAKSGSPRHPSKGRWHYFSPAQVRRARSSMIGPKSRSSDGTDRSSFVAAHPV